MRSKNGSTARPEKQPGRKSSGCSKGRRGRVSKQQKGRKLVLTFSFPQKAVRLNFGISQGLPNQIVISPYPSRAGGARKSPDCNRPQSGTFPRDRCRFSGGDSRDQDSSLPWPAPIPGSTRGLYRRVLKIPA